MYVMTVSQTVVIHYHEFRRSFNVLSKMNSSILCNEKKNSRTVVHHSYMPLNNDCLHGL